MPNIKKIKMEGSLPWVMDKFPYEEDFIGKTFPISQVYDISMAIALFVYRILQGKARSDFQKRETLRLIKEEGYRVPKEKEKNTEMYGDIAIYFDHYTKGRTVAETKKRLVTLWRLLSADHQISIDHGEKITLSIGKFEYKIQFVGIDVDMANAIDYATVIYIATRMVHRPAQDDPGLRMIYYDTKRIYHDSPYPFDRRITPRDSRAYLIEYVKKRRHCQIPDPFDDESPVSFYELTWKAPLVEEDPFDALKRFVHPKDDIPIWRHDIFIRDANSLLAKLEDKLKTKTEIKKAKQEQEE